jgi:glycine/serine hydroxymethyltransferase
MKEKEMKHIATWITQVIREVDHYRLPKAKEERSGFVKKVKAELWKNKKLVELGKKVKVFANKFPLP